MKLSQLALAAALAAVWAASPPTVRAHGGDGELDHDDAHHGAQRERREGMGGPHGDPKVREKFEAMRGLEKKVREISRNMRRGSDAEKAAAKTEARKALGEMFDAKLALEEAMLEKMEKHTAELKAKIAKKKSGREKAIENRLARMSNEDDDWD